MCARPVVRRTDDCYWVSTRPLIHRMTMFARYMSCFRCHIFVFGSTNGQFSDKEQMTAYCKAKGFRQPEQLAEACCSGSMDVVTRIMGMGMSGDYSNPASVMDRIKGGGLDIYGNNRIFGTSTTCTHSVHIVLLPTSYLPPP